MGFFGNNQNMNIKDKNERKFLIDEVYGYTEEEKKERDKFMEWLADIIKQRKEAKASALKSKI